MGQLTSPPPIFNVLNATSGVVDLVNGAATVNLAAVTADSRIFLTHQNLGTIATPVGLGVIARAPGVSFTISSQAGTDTSTVAWLLIEPS